MSADCCILCKSKEQDDVRYGDFLTKNNVSVHTYCLYLTSNLVQNGEDDEGFYGFLLNDILKEVKRTSKLQCCYCRKNYAGIGCCNTSCSRSFHLICGIENGANNQFTTSFLSYCHQHRPPAVTPIPPTKSNEVCCICYNALLTSQDKPQQCHVNIILSPCCKNGWFHKLCLQKFALTAGYFFKCPLCNDMKIFRKELPYHGIFIPDRDAAWELEPNAFADLLERPTTCSAKICHNTVGRSHNTKEDPLLFCETCGSQAIHTKCWLDKNGNREKQQQQQQGQQHYNCIECSATLEKLNISEHIADANEEILIENDDNEHSPVVIDVCNISDNSSDDDDLSKVISRKSFTKSRKNRLISSEDDTKKNIKFSTSSDSSDDKPLCYGRYKKIKKPLIYTDSSDDEQCANSENDERSNVCCSYDMDLNRKSIIQVHIKNDSTMCEIQDEDDLLCNLRYKMDKCKKKNNKSQKQIDCNIERPSTSQNGHIKNIMYNAFSHHHVPNSNSHSDFDSESDSKPLSTLMKEQNQEKNVQGEKNPSNQCYTAQRTRKRKMSSVNSISELPSPFRSHYSKKPRKNSDIELQCTRRRRRKRRKIFTHKKSSQPIATSQNSSDEEVYFNNKNLEEESDQSQALSLNKQTSETVRSNRTYSTRNRKASSISLNCEKEQSITSSVPCRSLRPRRPTSLYCIDISDEEEDDEDEEEDKNKKFNNLKMSCISIKRTTCRHSTISMNITQENNAKDISSRSRSSTTVLRTRRRRRGPLSCNPNQPSMKQIFNENTEENGTSSNKRSCVALRSRRKASQLFSNEAIPKSETDNSPNTGQSSTVCSLPPYDNPRDENMKSRRGRKRKNSYDSSRQRQIPKHLHNTVKWNSRTRISTLIQRRRRQRFSNKNTNISENNTRTFSLNHSIQRSEHRMNLSRTITNIQRQTSVFSLLPSPTGSLSSTSQTLSAPVRSLRRRRSNFS